jgi:hypothetical protein
MADSQHTIRRASNGGASRPSRRTMMAGASIALVASGMVSSPRLADSADETISLCRRWTALEAAVDKLWDEWADLESKLAHEHPTFFKLSDDERHQLPGGGARMREIEEIAAKLTPMRDALLPKLPRLKAHSHDAVLAKLVVASRLIIPEHEPEAYRIVKDSIKDLRRLHQLEA